ncbi:MAG TPA: cytochrome P450 [Acidimicrobiia bacterium]|nr:cytochrome P450 [Acidimicrobiia bacterium]
MQVAASRTGQRPLDDLVAELFGGDRGLIADPYPVYRRLREESPAHRYGPMVLVSRFDDVEAVFRDVERYSNVTQGSRTEALMAELPAADRPLFAELTAFEAMFMSRLDDPEHTRLRRLASRAFTPKRILALRESIQSLTDAMLGGLVAAGTADFIDGLAYRLPLAVITEMLGVPAGDRDAIHEWSAAIGRYRSDITHLGDAHRSVGEFRRYVEGLVAARRREPGSDLLAALLEAEEGDRLSEDELYAMFVLLLFAGHETTTNLIGNGLLDLLRHPGEWARLCAEPQLVPNAVEELLRHDAPVQWIARMTAAPVEVHGHEFGPGQTFLLMLGSANRDHGRFAEADRLDLGRDDVRHLGFGFGVHFCLGAALARLEAQVVFETLTTRHPDVTLAGAATWRPNTILRGVEALPLRFGSGRR